jgi:outer membrane protein OmpA-like peptidoglycan-associated protein
MKALFTGRLTVVLGAAAFMLIGTGCATKKYVGQVVTPVENRVGVVEKKSADNASAIGEVENNVSRVDERAVEADRKAAAAGQAANQAQQRADSAQTRADSAYGRADSANQLAESTRSRLGQVVDNIDNFKLVSTESILFGLNKHALTDEAKAQLDAAVGKIQGAKNFVLEIQGFTDKTGSASTNLALSQRRADSVVRYLTVHHNIPLRKISVLGIGEDDPNADNKTKEGRKQARRVEIKVFSLDLGTTTAANATSTTPAQE